MVIHKEFEKGKAIILYIFADVDYKKFKYFSVTYIIEYI